jgi:hypothetical protein
MVVRRNWFSHVDPFFPYKFILANYPVGLVKDAYGVSGSFGDGR